MFPLQSSREILHVPPIQLDKRLTNRVPGVVGELSGKLHPLVDVCRYLVGTQFVHQLAQTAQSLNVGNKIIFGCEKDGIEHVDQRIQFVSLQLKWGSREEECGASPIFWPCYKILDQQVQLCSPYSGSVALFTCMMGLIDDDEIPVDRCDLVASLIRPRRPRVRCDDLVVGRPRMVFTLILQIADGVAVIDRK